MAALRLNTVKNVSKHLQSAYNCKQIRPKSTKILTTPVGSLSNVENVATTSDGTTFVAWHPTPDFPYEHSLPLPPPGMATSTLLRDEAIETAMKAFGNKHPEIAKQELMRVTTTSYHTWRPFPRGSKINTAKGTPPDRKYL